MVWDDDYWTDRQNLVEPAAAAAPDQNIMSSIRVEVGPSDAAPPLAVTEALFGGGRAGFAILESGRLFALPERLEASGLQHDCLFDGKAREELGAVAPWLVELKDGKFLRALFAAEARGQGALSLWHSRAGLCISTDLTFDALRRHLRRFTRVQDATGNWHYLRFWQPEVLLDLADCLEPTNATAFFADLQFVVPDAPQGLQIVRRIAA